MSKRQLPVINELKYLAIDSPEGQDYLRDMRWCLNYAEQNRRIMLDELCAIVKSVTRHEADLTRLVNIHHNYCQQETIAFGPSPEELVWVTRKGATSARDGQLGIIPGSMGTGSFIVQGLGNPLSFYSCSHGAGRMMSRTMVRSRRRSFFSSFWSSLLGNETNLAARLRTIDERHRQRYQCSTERWSTTSLQSKLNNTMTLETCVRSSSVGFIHRHGQSGIFSEDRPSIKADHQCQRHVRAKRPFLQKILQMTGAVNDMMIFSRSLYIELIA